MSIYIPGQDLEVRIIASIWPRRLTAERPLYSGNFTIPPVNKGADPEVLVINHHVQWEQEPVTHRKRPETIISWQIAQDLVGQWAANGLMMSDAAGPGIWILQLPDGRYPNPNNPAEIKMALEYQTPAQRERQGRYFGMLIEAADVKAADENLRKGITPEEKMAAQYMGYDKFWLHDIRHGDMKACQFCSKSNPSSATKCQFCGEIIDPSGYALAEAMRNKELDDARKAFVDEAKGKAIPPPLQPTQGKGARV
jgi:ribosomal protein L40E